LVDIDILTSGCTPYTPSPLMTVEIDIKGYRNAHWGEVKVYSWVLNLKQMVLSVLRFSNISDF
jgi:hypothetical protein